MARAKSATKRAPAKKPIGVKNARAAAKPAKKAAPKAAAPAKKAAPAKSAAPAKKAAPVKSAAPKAAVTPAKSAAPTGGDAKARELIEIANEPLPSDQVKTCVAALELYELAKAGNLSPEVTLEAWRAGTCFNHATSQKATKAQQKLLTAAGFANPQSFVVENCRRWIAAGNTEDPNETFAVAWLLISNLLDLEQNDEAIAEFKRWTPLILAVGHAGKLHSTDWVDGWFGTYIWKVGLGDHKAEHARATTERDKEKQRA